MSVSKDDPQKILITGLPGAGVKTIKAVVVDNTPPKDMKAAIERLDIGNSLRDILQQRVLFLPCGGENSIQDVIDRDSDTIYQHVQALVFVLDVTEQSSYSIAKYWFDAFVQHLHKFSKDARIFLLLNKVDLLAENDNASDIIRATKNLFITPGLDIYIHETSIFDFITPGLDIYIHETSIFDASTYLAFKDMLTKEMDNQISIKQYLNRFIKDSCYSGLAVYSQDGLAIYEVGVLPPLVDFSANVILGSVERIAE
ncbi:MAG: hypothetical protein ACTSQ0_08335, partial [Candidatus Heimdallarchaeota archaeon]